MESRLRQSIDKSCDRFEDDWRLGRSPDIESFIGEFDAGLRDMVLRELLPIELHYRNKQGETIEKQELATRFRDDAEIVAEVFQEFQRNSDDAIVAKTGLQIRCPHCHTLVDVNAETTATTDMTCKECRGRFNLVGDSAIMNPGKKNLIGHFELQEHLGTGGFGTVWKARDTTLDRTVAIKIPRRSKLDSTEIEKFFREARTAAQLQHPNIVSVHEVGRDEDTIFIVSDFVNGTPLSEWSTDKKLSSNEAAKLCLKIANALQHAHHNGIIHRDLKPHNVMISDDGEPHLMDFGLARRDVGDVTLTVDGQVLGTPAYMSPEQASGQGHRADGRADIYSLGATMYKMLTGELPFRGNVTELIQQVLHDEPTSPRVLNRTIPRDLETICLKCLEKEPASRYQSAVLLAADLKRFLSHQPIVARPVGRFTRAWRWCKRNPMVAALSFAVAVSLLSGAIISGCFAIETAKKEKERTAAFGRELTYNAQAVSELRREGYRNELIHIVQKATELGETAVSFEKLRDATQLVIGDFVGHTPKTVVVGTADIRMFALHPKHQFIALGLSNGKIDLVHVNDGTKFKTFNEHARKITGLAVDENRIVSADESGRIVMRRNTANNWNIQQDFNVFTEPNEAKTLRAAKVSRDWKHLITLQRIEDGNQENPSTSHVVVWDLESQQELKVIDFLPDKQIDAVEMSPDSRRLVLGTNSVSPGTGFRIVDIDSGKSIDQNLPDLGTIYVNSLAFSPDGRWFAAGGDSAFAIYKVNDDFQELAKHSIGAIKAVAFSHDSRTLASIDDRGRVKTWSVPSLQEIVSLNYRRNKPCDELISFGDSGEYLVLCNANGLKYWQLTTDEKDVIAAHLAEISNITFSPDGRYYATGSKDETVCIWDVVTNQMIAPPIPLPGGVQCVAFSSDGQRLAIGFWLPDEPRTIRFWDIREAKWLGGGIENDLSDVNRIAFMGDDDRILAAAGDAGLGVWRIEGDWSHPPSMKFIQETREFEFDKLRCLDLAVTEDRLIACAILEGDGDCYIRVFDGPTILPVKAPLIHGWHSIAFHPKSKQLYYVSEEGNVEAWDIRENNRVSKFPNAKFSASHITMSRDGKWLAGIVEDNQVAVLDVESNERLISFRAEQSKVESLAWNLDATKLAVGLHDGGLIIWDLPVIKKELNRLGFPSADR